MLKALRKEDRAYKKPYKYTGDDKLIIDVRLENKESAYSPFSSKDFRRINPDLLSYISEENAVTRKAVLIRIKNQELYKNEDERLIFSSVLKDALLSKRKSMSVHYAVCLIKTVWCLALGLLILGASLLINYFMNKTGVILYVSLEILSWVLIWEAFDGFFFVRPERKWAYYHFSRLTLADFEFLPE